MKQTLTIHDGTHSDIRLISQLTLLFHLHIENVCCSNSPKCFCTCCGILSNALLLEDLHTHGGIFEQFEQHGMRQEILFACCWIQVPRRISTLFLTHRLAQILPICSICYLYRIIMRFLHELCHSIIFFCSLGFCFFCDYSRMISQRQVKLHAPLEDPLLLHALKLLGFRFWLI